MCEVVARLAVLVVLLGLRSAPADHIHPERGQLAHRVKRSLEQLLDTENQEFWMVEGKRELEEALLLNTNTRLAKNIVLVVGDGMSLSTVAAARVFKGQAEGRDGATSRLVWEKFPHFGLSRTYSSNALVPDSSATAFAMFSGVKTNYYTVGFDNTVVKGDPFSHLTANKVSTVLSWAQEAGMATGIVTTARVSHATPSALYARAAHRDWECDRKMPPLKPDQVLDISEQLVEESPGRNVDIILGGGRGSFTPAEYEAQLLLFSPNQTRFNSGMSNFDCSRLDNKDLVERWLARNRAGSFVQTRSELLHANASNSNKILGLFSWSYMPYEDELDSTLDIPTLTDMTAAALDFLKVKGGEKGFFLMVEGGRIDHGHHEGQAVRALSETVAMDRAVSEIIKQVNLTDTLVIVTADHSHTMTMGGYPGRKADIRGVAQGDDGWIMRGLDGHPFPILGYANGPGFKRLRVKGNTTKTNWEGIERGDMLEIDKGADYGFHQPSGVPLKMESHGGDDVGIWATGPMAHLFHATHQQTHIAHVMSLAGCIGPHKHHPRCNDLQRP